MTGAARLSAAVAIALLGAGVCPLPARADDAPPPRALDGIALHGFAEASWSKNFRNPASGTNQLRVFDFDDNTIQLDEVELVAERAAARPRDTGFRCDVTFGSSEPRVAASAGLFRDTNGVAGDIDVHQAFVSWLAPVGTGIRFDAGKFVTHAGYEVIDGYDGWNDQATRSLLFGYAIPFAHVGVRASYAPSSRMSGTVMVVNGWDVARDDNRAKTAGAQLVVAPCTALTVTLNGLHGAERPGNDRDARSLLDVVAVWTATPRFTFGLNADLAGERFGTTYAHWRGLAGYARTTVAGPLGLAVRAEWFDDPDGTRTGVAQAVREVTVTPSVAFAPRSVLRADVRIDASDHRVFETSAAPTKSQTTVLLGVLAAF